MIYKTHIVTSLSIGLIPYSTGLVTLNEPLQLGILVFVGFIFSLLPDLDEPNSYLSRRTPLIPFLLTKLTTHRAATHQIRGVFVVFISLMMISLFYPIISIYIPMAILAYIGHILGDSCTLSGIRRFAYPVSNKTFWILPKSMRFRTNSWTEKLIPYPLFSAITLFQLYIIVLSFGLIKNIFI